MGFEARYKKLNEAQKQAVDTIDGPVMVIAGPGTGKTELLSMRAANILKQTDTLAENILCLTFTDSGADAMRARLTDIIGTDAYKVAIHTFHSFGTEIINQNNEFFYNGATFKAADELTCYEILHSIFQTLPYDDPIASKMNNEYTYLRDTLAVISELKRAGLTSGELLSILDANDYAIDSLQKDLANIFSQRVSASALSLLVPVAHKAAELDTPRLPATITPLGNIIATSLAHAIDDAQASNSTKPITAWKNRFLEKDEAGKLVFKDHKRHIRLRAVCYVYDRYIARMQEEQLFDFDDMIMQVVHAIETHADLKYNLQEKYQYIMVDEFQDTNMAQSRILYTLTDNEVHNGRPNILVVGDDDQAIYTFQGADVSNIINFRHAYTDVQRIVLTNNYRSTSEILDASRRIITQGTDRLEYYIEDLDKSLVAFHKPKNPSGVQYVEATAKVNELAWVVHDIAQKIKAGASPHTIAVLARKHHELIELLPYFSKANIAVNYERRENVLDDPAVKIIETVGVLLLSLTRGDLATVNSMLPEFLSHPAWNFSAEDIWKLSLEAHKEQRQWLEVMATIPVFVPIYTWLIETARSVHTTPLEQLLDEILGTPSQTDESHFRLPFYEYFFSKEKLDTSPDAYLTHLEALRAIRQKVREYQPNELPTFTAFIESIELHRQTNTPIVSVRHRLSNDPNAINLMTAHKSKGLEFETVYIVGASDATWGEKARSRNRMITYPENLTLTSPGSSLDERLRLFFVAMTRAQDHLIITNAAHDDNGKETSAASFLMKLEADTEVIPPSDELAEQLETVSHDWYMPLIKLPSVSLKHALAPTLARYKLSATHLNQFLDVAAGGPQHFLVHTLLRFPSAMSPAAAYGSAIHATLQKTHNHLRATGELKPLEDILHDFEQLLSDRHLSEHEYDTFLKRGSQSLQRFIHEKQHTFTKEQRAEANFSNQQAFVGAAHLTGALDLMDVNTIDKTIRVTDYKTGTPTRSWQGKTDYEKIKLHKYKQQLMFYKLLIEHSRDYHSYVVEEGILQFVEPTRGNDIIDLTHSYSASELTEFARLVEIIWNKITTLDLPDTSHYDPTYRGMLAFEQDLLSGN